MKYFAAVALLMGIGAAPVWAADQSQPSAAPAKLSDGEMDQVVAGDPLIFVNVAAPINVHIEPISVRVDIPVNVAAVVQANVLGNAAFDAVAVGTQNVFNAASTFTTPGG